MKLKKIPGSETRWEYVFGCPACNEEHTINNTWEFDGNYELPTISPSILVEGYRGDKNTEYGSPFRCHSWITNGKIKFFEDCSHDTPKETWLDLLEIQ